ncbi:MAG TPA: hypothetical protein VLX91_16445 [Candidatus Acidoferrales bacterium]|nr:hypothetical protein [Candidatus Acidoferrales bacterium]
MNKVVQAVNSMILKSDRITQITDGIMGELFFLYDQKYKWSILKSGLEYYLHFYRTDMPISELAQIQDWDRFTNIFSTFSTKELKTREANESFAELYQLLRNRRLDMDKALDDIIGDENA